MPRDDYAKELLCEQMVRRKKALLQAIRASDVSVLPRVRVQDRAWQVCREEEGMMFLSACKCPKKGLFLSDMRITER